jgi:hypothetical protein
MVFRFAKVDRFVIGVGWHTGITAIAFRYNELVLQANLIAQILTVFGERNGLFEVLRVVVQNCGRVETTIVIWRVLFQLVTASYGNVCCVAGAQANTVESCQRNLAVVVNGHINTFLDC